MVNAIVKKKKHADLLVQCDLFVLIASPLQLWADLYRGEFLFIVSADLTPAEEMHITVNTHLSPFCLYMT